jgi:transcriptional regulator with XRE-family HTH domain
MSEPRKNGRSCVVCGARLAGDNTGGMCSPCDRGRVEDARPPPTFWTSDTAARAIARGDFGLVIKAAREACDPCVTQAGMGLWLGLSQAQVSRIESGRTPTNDLAKLVRWAQILGAPAGSLWFDFPAGPGSVTVDKVISYQPPALPPAAAAPPPSLVPGSRRMIGLDDVDVVREATRAFRQIDNRFGGGHARSAVASFLGSEIEGALSDGRFARGARPGYERAAAELFQLAGWMAYDVGDERQGRSRLRQALELATAAGDESLTAEMLAAMSHQAVSSRRSDEAIDLALAARRAAHRSGAPALQAESAALEARGLALAGDARGCIAALGRAERVFGSATDANTPNWLRYFDRAYLSATFAHALRDLGRPRDAERFARDSLLMSEGYDRGRLFNTALLASILAGCGRIDESVAAARQALEMAGKVRSVRAQGYLRDIATRLMPFEKVPDVSRIHRDIKAAGVNLRQ